MRRKISRKDTPEHDAPKLIELAALVRTDNPYRTRAPFRYCDPYASLQPPLKARRLRGRKKIGRTLMMGHLKRVNVQQALVNGLAYAVCAAAGHGTAAELPKP